MPDWLFAALGVILGIAIIAGALMPGVVAVRRRSLDAVRARRFGKSDPAVDRAGSGYGPGHAGEAILAALALMVSRIVRSASTTSRLTVRD